jgi:hypothetical protein
MMRAGPFLMFYPSSSANHARFEWGYRLFDMHGNCIAIEWVLI